MFNLCKYIFLTDAHLKLHVFSDDWQGLLNECLCHEVANIRSNAAIALEALCSQYYQNGGKANQAKCMEIIKLYTSNLAANDEVTRVGHALALGKLFLFID